MHSLRARVRGRLHAAPRGARTALPLLALLAPLLAPPAGLPAQDSRIGVVPSRTGRSSDNFARLFPSRVKTFAKASYDPDDRPSAPSRGNDDGFSGLNLSESYRTQIAGNPVAVLAHFEGRPGVLGLFFRNFWSDFAGLPRYPGEDNRTSIWIDGALAHDLPLSHCFRNESDPNGQIPPFLGPFTGNRSGGHLTHAPLRWQDQFVIGLWDDGFHNAARFHRVAATIGTPEGEVPVASMEDWVRIDRTRGSWPHRSPRSAQTVPFQIPPHDKRKLQFGGPATLLELTCQVGSHEDWDHLWASFYWDGETAPSVHVPLRVLGGMMRPPHRHAVTGLLFHNDGDRRITTYLPMPWRTAARLEFHNKSGSQRQLTVTCATVAGGYPEPWGHFTAIHRSGVTVTGQPFAGPRITDARGMLRGLLLEDVRDDTGRIPDMHHRHLEGDLCVRINGLRGDEHTFDASETSIGRWGWYDTPADRAFQSDTSFQTGLWFGNLPGNHFEAARLMGSLYVFDPIHFVDGIEVVLEHGVQNDSNADYALTAFLYVEPGAARRTIAEIDIGDPVSEAAHQVQFTQWSQYVRTGAFLRDQFFGTPPVTDSIRHVRDFLRFRVQRPAKPEQHRPLCVGFRLDRLMGPTAGPCQASVLVDGAPAGLLHVFSHNAVFPWKEGGECEVELPRALTDGKAALTVEVRPRPGSTPLRVARAWVYEYVK